MTIHVAVTHYPEGAGHATRMMAVARGLQRRGAEVALAGGGPGRRLYEPNGYSAYEPPQVDYIGDYQDAGNPVSGLARVLTGSLPDSVGRVRGIASWLRGQDPDAVVTDDMFTVAAAAATDMPLYVLSHNAAALYRDPIIRASTMGINASQRLAAERFFYPSVWPPADGDPPGVSRVPPVALPPPEGAPDGGPDDPGVVLVPSTYSTDFDALADRLRAAGHRVTLIGDHDWGPVPSLLPVLRRAEAVVCSGYSTVMEAAVAETPCVVYPATNEQDGIARRVAPADGFRTATDPAAVETALSEFTTAPEYANGIATIAERLLDDLTTSTVAAKQTV
ncbi:glycosyltransferase [Natronomonas marina]|uniref:glycosyltransferase n=1 Tax=Natronomonas marina TaxID=2961939 RepID=UPI0020CA1900|nr:glycosyltransferase [Natronomonas marina]